MLANVEKKALNSIYGGGNSYYPRFVFYNHNKQPVGTTRMFFFFVFFCCRAAICVLPRWLEAELLVVIGATSFFFFSNTDFHHGSKNGGKNTGAVCCVWICWNRRQRSDEIQLFLLLQCSSLQQPPPRHVNITLLLRCHQFFPAIAQQQRPGDANVCFSVAACACVRACFFSRVDFAPAPVYLPRCARSVSFFQTVNRLSSHSGSH